MTRAGFERPPIVGHGAISALIGRRSLFVSRKTDESTNDQDDDTDADHETDILKCYLAKLSLVVGLKEGRRATFRSFTSFGTNVVAGTNLLRGT